MSSDGVNAVLERAMVDDDFRKRLAKDPADALAGFDLSDDERAAFTAGSVSAERLEERMSKTDLSSMIGGKTSSPNLKPPSGGRKP